MYTYNYIFIYIQLYEYVKLCIHTFIEVIINVYTYNYTHFCNRLHLIKKCLSCFSDMHLHSNNLSTVAKISSLKILELFPACFSCNSNFNLSHKSSGSDDKILLKFEKP